MESEGIHRVRVPGTPFTAILVVVAIANVLVDLPSLRCSPSASSSACSSPAR